MNSKTKKGENENIYTKQQHEEQEENGGSVYIGDGERTMKRSKER
jgi:hypothetical protein